MTTQGGPENGCALRLLSIDGGGIRGLSPLLMLREILSRIQREEQLPDLPRPCDVFDLAGGTNTGGLIVIMLFRLQMSVDEAITAYASLAKRVFSERRLFRPDANFRATQLEEAVIAIIQESLKIGETEARSIRLVDEERPKCFVCAMPAENTSFPTLFRTWIPAANQSYNCTIIQAVRATNALPAFFKDIEFGEPIKQRYTYGTLGCNNPVKYVIGEARSMYPNRSISCVVSLGTGAENVIGLDRPDAFQRLLPTNLIGVLKCIATDCEKTSEETARELAAQSILYCRLNVDQGLQDVSLAEWEKLEAVQLHTVQYLQKYVVDGHITQIVQALSEKALMLPTTELSPAESEAFKELKESISVNAYHDSQARSTSSGCLPGTRTEQIENIMRWIGAQHTGKLLVVLGPAGSGKSSLLWTVAQICKREGSYAAGFFFSGTDSERNTGSRFVNTISYQICESIPELRPHVARAVKAEASILSRSLQSQLDCLLLRPLTQLQSGVPNFSFGPRIIVIDALNECGNEIDQHQVVTTLTDALSHGSFPFCCVLSSRFDQRIESILSCDPTLPLIHTRVKLGLAEAEEMQDIRTYLEEKVNDIRRSHPYGARIPEQWHAESDLRTIVERSGGQFIYAATVIRYIESALHNPYKRLQHILGISTPRSGTNPFAALDDLYRALMSLVPPEHRDTALEILGIELVKSSFQCWIPMTLIWRAFFEDHFAKLDVDIVLGPLASVLKYERCRIKFYHLSFAEFLLDSTRSREFFVDPTKWQMWIISHLVPYFYADKNIDQYDIDYLIEEAKPGTELHQAIKAGHNLVVDYPKRLHDGGDFNLWPFVTWSFFWTLQFHISIEKIASVFLQRGDHFLPLPILMDLAATHKLSNSFLLFELCYTITVLENTGFIQHAGGWNVGVDRLMSYTNYLANYFYDQRSSLTDQNILLPEDYQSATLCCLWYLQTPRSDICSRLRDQFHSLDLQTKFGIPDYLRDTSNNITRGALGVLFSLLPRSPPSIDLIASLKQPFDAEVISMNPSSSRKARKFIHEYLTDYDANYRGLLEETDEAAEDEPLPHFDRFLIQNYKQYNLSSSYVRRNG